VEVWIDILKEPNRRLNNILIYINNRDNMLLYLLQI